MFNSTTFADLGRRIDGWIDATLDRAFARHDAQLFGQFVPEDFSLIVADQRGWDMEINVTRPKNAPRDTNAGEFTYTIDSGESKVVTGDFPLSFTAPVDSTVVGTLMAIDKKGNKSGVSQSVSLVVTDKIAPPIPEGFELIVVGEDPEGGEVPPVGGPVDGGPAVPSQF